MTTKTVLGGLPDWVAHPDPSIYWSKPYVVLDFETTTELKGSPLAESNRLILACWRVVRPRRVGGRGKCGEPELSYDYTDKFVFGSEYDMGELVEDIAATGFCVAHNAKFESGWLRRCGVDLRKLVTFDTMIAEHVLGGNRFMLRQLGLNACLERHGLAPKESTIGLMFKAGIPTTWMPDSWLLKYCIRDVEATHELFLKQRPKLKAEKLEAINYQRNLVTPCLADIEFNGMQLDTDNVVALEKKTEDEYIQLTAEFQRFCDGANPSSPKQMQPFIYETLGFSVPKDHRGKEMLTGAGAPSTRADVLVRLVARTQKQARFLDLHQRWTRLHSDLTKYMRKFGECCDEDDGLLLGSFNQCSTRTHRLSSSGTKYKVQFQNFNRTFKPLFRARHSGWLMGEADGAQLEFRVAAHLGQDAVALRDIVSGADIHSYTASIIGCSRQEAKAHTFKPLYGGYSGTPGQQRYYAAFKEKYKGVADEQQRWTHQVLKDKQLTTEWGMKYYWPDTYMAKSGYITNTTSIYNYPVQAFATAEIIPLALVSAWHRMKDMQSFLVNTVHDSIIAELHPDEVETWHEIAKTCLIEDCYHLIRKLYSVHLTVPLGAGVMVGSHWANKEAKDSEVVYNAPKELWEKSSAEV